MAQEPHGRPLPPQPDPAPRRYKDAPTTIEPDGYVWEWCPTHPSAKRGVVLQHRLVAECALGRFLTKRERVHHRNEHRWDNRWPGNLEIHESHSAHMREHWANKGRRSPEWIERVRLAAADPNQAVSAVGLSPSTILAICEENGIQWIPRVAHQQAAELTEQSAREALQGRTTRQAAEFLGVALMTLHRRFGHLLNKRPSPKFLDAHRAEILRLLTAEHMTRAEIAERYGASRVTVTKAIQRWRAQDAKRAASAQQSVGHRHRKPKPSRTAQDMAERLP